MSTATIEHDTSFAACSFPAADIALLVHNKLGFSVTVGVGDSASVAVSCRGAVSAIRTTSVSYVLYADSGRSADSLVSFCTGEVRCVCGVMKVAEVFATANYAVNFVLYCVSGSVFRQGVRRLVCRPERRLRRHGGQYHAAEVTRAL